MTDILERAKTCQRENAQAATLMIRLAFLQDMIAEIERLQAMLRDHTPTIREIRERHEPKAVPFSSGKPEEDQK